MTTTHYFKNYSEKDMEAIKQELSEADIGLSPAKAIQDIELKPLKWQEGDIAISPIHFYMIYNDPEKDITIRSINRVTGTSDTHCSFLNREDAQDWIKDSHCPLIQERLNYFATEYGISIGQKWLSKKTKCILEITMIEDDHVHVNIYNESKTGYSVEKMNYPIIRIGSYLTGGCLLMLDSETVADCLTRCGTGSEIL